MHGVWSRGAGETKPTGPSVHLTPPLFWPLTYRYHMPICTHHGLPATGAPAFWGPASGLLCAHAVWSMGHGRQAPAPGYILYGYMD
jgi:hypothetical protein